MSRLSADSVEHLVGGGPRVDDVGADIGPQPIPTFTGGQLSGAQLEAPGHDLAELFTETELAPAEPARLMLRWPRGGR